MSSTATSASQTPLSSGPPSSAPTPPPGSAMPKGVKPVTGSKKPYVLTPEQEAKKLARAQAKALAPAADAAETDVSKRSKEQIAMGKFLQRDWVNVGDKGGVGDEKKRVKVGSWNMLAQTLVRRELFPGSDCLKWSDRHQMLVSELLSFKTDVLALQEVDRLEHLLPHLPAYANVQAKGRGKAHGLVILYRKEMFEKVEEKVVMLDEEEVRSGGEEMEGKTKRGGTRETKNIGLVVGLKRSEDRGGSGMVVVTTHLFWHPLYSAERCRQLGLLLRAALRFRTSISQPTWPIVMMGDFNCQPSEPSYTLLTSSSSSNLDPLSQQHKDLLRNSAQIHKSLIKVCAPPSTTPEESAGIPEFIPPDAVAPPAPSNRDEDDDEGEGQGGGSSGGDFMKDTRPPILSDGILSVDEMVSLYRDAGAGQVRSLYAEAARMPGASGGEGDRTFGSRGGFGEEEKGRTRGQGEGEPNWTSYTPLWHLTLDYIFLLEGSGVEAPKIRGYLRPHRTEDLEPGLPRKGVSASDHVAVAGEIEF